MHIQSAVYELSVIVWNLFDSSKASLMERVVKEAWSYLINWQDSWIGSSENRFNKFQPISVKNDMFRLAYFPEFTIVFVFPRLPSVVYKHANDPGPEMIPRLYGRWSRTGNGRLAIIDGNVRTQEFWQWFKIFTIDFFIIMNSENREHLDLIPKG